MKSRDSLLLVRKEKKIEPASVRGKKKKLFFFFRYIIPDTSLRWLRRLTGEATFRDKSLAWALAPTAVLRTPSCSAKTLIRP